jgi:hypothetical protein
LPVLTVSYTGLVNGDTAGTFSAAPNTAPAITTTATATSHVGSYAITASGAVDADYTISYAAGTLTVNPALLTITADGKMKTYGGPLPVLTVSYTGLVNGDTAGTFSAAPNTAPAITTTATATSHVGTYAITASGAVDADYTISYAAGTLTVSPASTSISTSAATATYGDASVTLSATVTDSSSGSTAMVNEGTVTFTIYQGITKIGSSVNSGTVSGNTASATFPLGILVNMGSYTIQATYNTAATNSNFTASTTTSASAGLLKVNPAPTTATITLTNSSFQYSDPVTFTITVSPINPYINVNQAPPASGSVTFYVGPQPPSTSVPASAQKMGTCTLSSNASNQLTCSVTKTLLEPAYPSPSPNNMAPGSHTVYALFSSVNSNFSVTNPVNSILTINPEDARVTYAGNIFVGIPLSSTSAPITLIATIQDITAVTGDPAYDAYPGDIRNATLTFVNRDASNATLCTAPVLLVDSSDPKTGSVTCTFTGSVGSSGSTQYTVGIVVGNYYTRDASTDNTVVTISQVGAGMITGGGYLVMQNSAGTIAGDPGTKNNFGFNVQYKQVGGTLHGNINSIVRRKESDGIQHVYQIKGNSMTALAVYQWVNNAWVAGCTGATSTSPCKAQFNGKANIQDITNPAAAIGILGNDSLQFNMTDYGSPGSSDTLGITLWNGTGGIWFSTKWVGTPPATVEQLLGGGNLVVH